MVSLWQDVHLISTRPFLNIPNIIGIYSGIFAMYLQRPQNNLKSRTAVIISYALGVLYVLSTVNAVIDFAAITIELEPVSKNPICKRVSIF